jgi:hypothetical protein
LSEEDLKEVAKELFNELKGKDMKLTIAAFKAWGDIKEMIEDGVMTKKELDEMVSEVCLYIYTYILKFMNTLINKCLYRYMYKYKH